MSHFLKSIALGAALVAGVATGLCMPSRSASRFADAPELGESMNTLARRFASLHFALEGRNSPLAAYELEEIHEVLEHIVAVPRVEHGIDVPMMLIDLEARHLVKIREAASAGAFDAAKAAYRAAMAACNTCHVATAHEFIAIVEPRAAPVVNLDYSAAAAVPR